MTCPFYGQGDTGLGVLMPTQGNQCAVVRIAHSPCRMEMAGLAVEWESCCLRRVPGPDGKGRLARCAGCGNIDWYAEAEGGLCHTCLHDAERLAAEAAGQQRLIP